MRNIYLVRHGEPDAGGRRYLGVTDPGLSLNGRREAGKLGSWFSREYAAKPSEVRIFSSPLKRCLETAWILQREIGCGPVSAADGLHEINLGSWDGETVRSIRERYPAEYEARGRDLWNYRTPGGESFAEAAKRFGKALDRICSRNPGDLIIVTHAGVIRGWICRKTGRTMDECMRCPVPYGSAFRLTGGRLCRVFGGPDEEDGVPGAEFIEIPERGTIY